MKRITYDGKPASLILESQKQCFFVNESIEDSMPEGVLMRLKGTFAGPFDDTKNRNGRTYDFTNYYSQVQTLMPKIHAKSLLGELEHCKRRQVKYANVSHRINEIHWNPETKCFEGTIDLLDTPSGRIAYGVAKAGSPLYISSRAIGVVDNQGRTTLLKLVTYDLVAEPGFMGASFNPIKVNQINESICYINESICYVNESEDDDDWLDDDETQYFTNDSNQINENMNEQNKNTFVAAYLSADANTVGIAKMQKVESILDKVGCDYTNTGLAIAYDKLSVNDKKEVLSLLGCEYANENANDGIADRWNGMNKEDREALLAKVELDAKLAGKQFEELEEAEQTAIANIYKSNFANEGIVPKQNFINRMHEAYNKVESFRNFCKAPLMTAGMMKPQDKMPETFAELGSQKQDALFEYIKEFGIKDNAVNDLKEAGFNIDEATKSINNIAATLWSKMSKGERQRLVNLVGYSNELKDNFNDMLSDVQKAIIKQMQTDGDLMDEALNIEYLVNCWDALSDEDKTKVIEQAKVKVEVDAQFKDLNEDDQRKLAETMVDLDFAQNDMIEVDEAVGMPVWQNANAQRRKALLKAAGINSNIEQLIETPWLALDNSIRAALNSIDVVNEAVASAQDWWYNASEADRAGILKNIETPEVEDASKASWDMFSDQSKNALTAAMRAQGFVNENKSLDTNTVKTLKPGDFLIVRDTKRKVAVLGIGNTQLAYDKLVAQYGKAENDMTFTKDTDNMWIFVKYDSGSKVLLHASEVDFVNEAMTENERQWALQTIVKLDLLTLQDIADKHDLDTFVDQASAITAFTNELNKDEFDEALVADILKYAEVDDTDESYEIDEAGKAPANEQKLTDKPIIDTFDKMSDKRYNEYTEKANDFFIKWAKDNFYEEDYNEVKTDYDKRRYRNISAIMRNLDRPGQEGLIKYLGFEKLYKELGGSGKETSPIRKSSHRGRQRASEETHKEVLRQKAEERANDVSRYKGKTVALDNAKIPGGWGKIVSIEGDKVKCIAVNAGNKEVDFNVSEFAELNKKGKQQFRAWQKAQKAGNVNESIESSWNDETHAARLDYLQKIGIDQMDARLEKFAMMDFEELPENIQKSLKDLKVDESAASIENYWSACGQDQRKFMLKQIGYSADDIEKVSKLDWLALSEKDKSALIEYDSTDRIVNESVAGNEIYAGLSDNAKAIIDKHFPESLVGPIKNLEPQGASLSDTINTAIETAKANANANDANSIESARDEITKWLAGVWQTTQVNESHIKFMPKRAKFVNEDGEDFNANEIASDMIDGLKDASTLDAKQADELSDEVIDSPELKKAANAADVANVVAKKADDLGYDVDVDDCMSMVNESEEDGVRNALLKDKAYDDFDFKVINDNGVTKSVVVAKADNQLVGIEVEGDMTEQNTATLASLLNMYLTKINTDESLLEIRKQLKHLKLDESKIATMYDNNGSRIIDESFEFHQIEPMWKEKMPAAYKVIFESLTAEQQELVANQAAVREFVNESDVASFFRTRNWNAIRSYQSHHSATFINENANNYPTDDEAKTIWDSLSKADRKNVCAEALMTDSEEAQCIDKQYHTINTRLQQLIRTGISLSDFYNNESLNDKGFTEEQQALIDAIRG